MRMTIIIMLLSITQLFAVESYSQNAKISLNVNDQSVKEVLYKIQKQSEFFFMFNSKLVDVERKVNIKVKNEKINKVLDKLFTGTSTTYTVIDRQIVLSSNEIIVDQQQQKKKLTGTVTDNKGAPLPGASVVVQGTTDGGVTNADGFFIINVPQSARTLTVSFIGMKKQNVVIGNKTSFEIALEPEVIGLNDVVVIGYMSQKKGLLTGSVVSMNVTDEIKTIPTTSAGNILAGKLSGVNVSTPNGIPGTAPSISIRTSSSWNSQPVTYVIDGVIRGTGDFNNLSPNEIETITVLKDAASAAVYGSRSAGGVILVTTKRGNIGKPVFNYSVSGGFDTRTKNASLTNAVETGELYNRINGTSDPAGWAWSQAELDHYKTVNNGWGYSQLDAVWQNPSILQHNLSVTGGSEKVRYFAGGSYIKQQGFLAPLTYDKYNFRLNVTVDVTKNFQIFAGLGLTNNLQGTVTWAGTQDLYRKLLVWQPDQPVFTDSGQPIDYGWIANVGATVKGDGGYDKTNFLKPQLVFNTTYKFPFLDGLSAKGAFSKNYSYNKEKIFEKNYIMNVMKRAGVNRHIISTDDASIVSTKMSSNISKDYLRTNIDWGQDYQLDLQLNYDHTFNKHHHVQGVFAYEKTESNGSSVYAGRETFPVYLTDQWWAASDARSDSYAGGSSDWVTGRASYIGQFNYDYSNKYLVNFSFREDGSMNFAPSKRWGFFPAGSVGWVVSEEPFFSNIKETINNFKIRASVGLTGNDAVGGWQWQESYTSANSAYFGTTPSPSVGITYGSVVNPNLTWEKALSYNFGFDANFYKHWSTSVEYWFKKSYDILGTRNAAVPTTFSLTLPSENYGQINAQGFDFSLGYQNKTGDLSYSGNFTLSYGWNKTIKQDYAENAQWVDIPVGKSRSYIIGYQFDQILKTQDQLDKFNAAHPGYLIGGISPELGMMVYKDVSGPDGKPDGIIDSWDRGILKKSNFPIVFGLSLGAEWKGFSVDLMLNGNLKQQKSFADLASGVEWNRMWSEWYGNSWTSTNTNAWLPKRMSAVASNTYSYASSFWYKDASFVRLKYVNIGYTIPKKLYSNVLDKVKVFFSGTNLFTLSRFTYYDPEIDNGTAYPVMRSFNFGIDISF